MINEIKVMPISLGNFKISYFKIDCVCLSWKINRIWWGKQKIFETPILIFLTINFKNQNMALKILKRFALFIVIYQNHLQILTCLDKTKSLKASCFGRSVAMDQLPQIKTVKITLFFIKDNMKIWWNLIKLDSKINSFGLPLQDHS